MDPIRVIIETIFEVPKVIIKTTCKVPEVVVETSQAGGGCIGGIGCLIIIILLLVGAVRGCFYMTETYVIKEINPNYKTSFEVAEERAEEEKKREAEEEKERKTHEKGKENIESSIRNDGYDFTASDYSVLDNKYVWSCGSLPVESGDNDITHNSRDAVAFSDDGGKSYRILWEKPSFCYSTQCKSKILFFDRNGGFLVITSVNAASAVYLTKDGGKEWDFVLTTERMRTKKGEEYEAYTVKDISTLDGQSVVVELQKHSSFSSMTTRYYPVVNDSRKRLMKSNDGGRVWIYMENNKQLMQTRDGGSTWDKIE